MDEKNLTAKMYQKINACMLEIKRVQKNGRNEYHKYDYVTESDILETVRPIMVNHQLHIGFSLVSTHERPKNDKQMITTANILATVTDCETGYRESYQWAGTGEDSGDKGLYKAMTGAQKYFLMKFFAIPTGDDPENDTGNTVKPGNDNKPKNEVFDKTLYDIRELENTLRACKSEKQLKATAENIMKKYQLDKSDKEHLVSVYNECAGNFVKKAS